jgi:hypothetical protein
LKFENTHNFISKCFYLKMDPGRTIISSHLPEDH